MNLNVHMDSTYRVWRYNRLYKLHSPFLHQLSCPCGETGLTQYHISKTTIRSRRLTRGAKSLF